MPRLQKDFAEKHHFIPPALLSGLLHYAENQHIEYMHWMDGISLDIAQIKQGTGFISFQEICTVVRRALADLRDPALGVKVGITEGLMSMGILGFAMQSCQTLEQALATGMQYHPVSGSVLDMDYQMIKDGTLAVVVTERYPCGDLYRFFCDEFFSSIITCMNAMLGDHDDLIAIHLSFPRPADTEPYLQHFGCPVHFSSAKNTLTFHSTLLQRQIRTYSMANFSTAIRMCDQLMQDIQTINQNKYASVLDYLIEQHLPDRFDMLQAAEHMKISERHLRRMLLMENISFQQIRQQVLERKAKELLLQDISISTVSEQLGFSELREFRRAFKRWTGQAPSDFKKLMISSE